ncbi:ABC transporter permease [Acetobacteraceae bacterium KSS8]|uniref:ABC transporter permease n=1 Tax=Endosaccharibacter trunci TaxID=2812733 RepID=A0ABT1W542_9PROT|nr:ABC transporter permease [Acetobacteraceae bacterium KSS8]
MTVWRLVLRLAWRDWRGGTGLLRGMGVVLCCLALGVAAIGAIGGLRDAIQDGVSEQRRAILGGDLAIETTSALPPELAAFLRRQGDRVSDTVRMRTMLYGPGKSRMLVQLSAVDAAYPLVGEATVQGGEALQRALASGSGMPVIAADPVVMERLAAHPGDLVRLGRAQFRLAASLDKVPDAAGLGALAPGVFIRRDALDRTGLAVPGALLTGAVRAVLPAARGPETDAIRLARARAQAASIDRAFPGTGWRIRDIEDAAPAITRAVDQVAAFMSLIALAALLLGGMGVAAGVQRWLDGRVRTVAILRTLGGTPRFAAAVVGTQVAALCLLGIVAGAVSGLIVPPVAVALGRDLLPVAPRAGVRVTPVLLASLFGIVVALLFALLPMARAISVPPSVLFRGPAGIAPPDRRRRLRVTALSAALVACLVLLAVLASPDRRLAIGFCLVAAVVLLLFRLAGAGLVRLVRVLPRPRAGRGVLRVGIRLGLASLGRAAGPATRLLLGFGAGLTVLATIALAEGDLRASLLDQLPSHAPSFYFIDIQPNEMDRFRALVASQPGAGAVHALPSLRTRVVAVNGVPADQVRAEPGTGWALQGDHGLTIAARPPAGTALAEGRWWSADYDGPPLISLDARLASGWHLGVGGTLRLNVLGRDIDFRVANLRDVAWRSLQLNFAFVASPGLLSAAPHTMVATVETSAAPAVDARILGAVTDALPGVTGIRVADILQQIGGIVGKLALALAAVGLVALLSGALVLAASLAATQEQRTREAAILRALGATAAQLRAAWLVEFAVLGLVAGLCAGAIGAVLSLLLMRAVLHAPFVFLPGLLSLVAFCAILLMLSAGFLATRRSLSASPAVLLRDT